MYKKNRMGFIYVLCCGKRFRKSRGIEERRTPLCTNDDVDVWTRARMLGLAYLTLDLPLGGSEQDYIL